MPCTAQPSVQCDSSEAVYDLRFLLPVVQFAAGKFTCSGSHSYETPLAQMLAVAVAALTAHDVVLRTYAIRILRLLREAQRKVK